MKFLSIFKKTLRLAGWSALFVLTSGVIGAVAYAALLPRLSAWPLTSHIAWPGSVTNGPTVIERTEQVVLSQEEGLERFAAAPRTAVVSIVSLATERTARTLPSGTVQEVSGLLVTNDGFVAAYMDEAPLSEARRFTVFFSDGESSPAEFVAYDPVVHVAYFRTERSDTPAIAFANSTDIRQGRRFMALAGTTDPDEGRLATGYIGERARTFNLSAKTVAATDEWEGVFLPDRLIDTRFIGGAAVALDGELIGLIGALSLDGTERVFILPANALRQSLQRVIGGTASGARANIGAYYVSLTKVTALALGVSRDAGALIYTPSERSSLAVISGSAAERAGLRYGDIVTAVNGQAISIDRPFSVALYEAASGGEATLSVLRGESELTLYLAR
ncbi:MAG: serine protease [Candidatus Moraniibacteriota bacterium]|nr:MAG: serine protease [Candidatus Moranbacteria bacterium]